MAAGLRKAVHSQYTSRARSGDAFTRATAASIGAPQNPAGCSRAIGGTMHRRKPCSRLRTACAPSPTSPPENRTASLASPTAPRATERSVRIRSASTRCSSRPIVIRTRSTASRSRPARRRPPRSLRRAVVARASGVRRLAAQDFVGRSPDARVARLLFLELWDVPQPRLRDRAGRAVAALLGSAR